MTVYNASLTDSVIVVPTSTENATVNLPTSPVIGQTYKIIDGDGNAETHPIYINGNGNLVNGMPATTEAITTVVVDMSPSAIAITPNGNYVYVANSGGSITDTGTVSVIKNASIGIPAVVKTLDNLDGIGAQPIYIAITPDGNRAYVVNGLTGSGSISSINNVNSDNPSKLVDPISISGDIVPSITITPGGTHAYVPSYTDGITAGTVTLINGVTTGSPAPVGSPLSVGLLPLYTVITPDGTHAYVVNKQSNFVSAFSNASTDSPIPLTNILAGTFPNWMAITPDGNYGYITSVGQTGFVDPMVRIISGVSTDSTSIVIDIDIGLVPNYVVISNDGNYAYVFYSSGVMAIIENASSIMPRLLTVLPIGPTLTDIVISSDGNYAYVLKNTGGGTSGDVYTIKNTSSSLLPTILDNSIRIGVNPYQIVITPDNGRLYVSNKNDDTVSVIPTAYTIPSVQNTVSVIDNPYDLAITPNGRYAYVLNSGGSSVSVIQNVSTSTPSVLITLNVESGPNSVAITPDGTRAYITNGGDSSVSVIANASTRTPTILGSPIAVGLTPIFIAITPDGNLAYVVNNESETVSIIHNVSTGIPSVFKTLTSADGIGTLPIAIAITPSGNRAYIANSSGAAGTNNHSIAVIENVSTETPSNLKNIDVGVGITPFDLAITPDGNYVYIVTLYSNKVFVIKNATTGDPAVVKTFTLASDANPYAVAITPNGNYAYIINSGNNTYALIRNASTDNPEIVNIYGTGVTPTDIEITPDGNYAYIINSGSNELLIIQDASTDNIQLLNLFQVGVNPFSVKITPDGKYAYIANYLSNSVSQINIITDNFEKINNNHGSDILVYNGDQWSTY